MPRRDDLHTILLLGSGPIVIGQACEFDYSGVQACKALRAEGYRVVLVNSNPATIMTDPQMADATYVEPLTAAYVTQVIAAEQPGPVEGGMALLPTLGGQTALNIAVELAESGVLDRYGVELIGAGLEAIDIAEDRRRFTDAMVSIGLGVAASARATTVTEALAFASQSGYPLLVRSSFTLGGAGSGIARDPAAFVALVEQGLAASPIGEVQIDESLLGWKEFELEVMRDAADNCVVVCSIENVDPMGVHTGDSITVAPAMTLTDADYQAMRDAAFAVMRRVGVATGGSNVQFAVDPATGRMVVIEMNPRVSRSSALASKATGFPIAKIAALLAVGYTLDEIANDITGETLAAFEPSIDYVVVKIPRFAFEQFPDADAELTTRMKSVGEVMAIGRTFTESLGKALRSLDNGTVGLVGNPGDIRDDATLEQALRTPSEGRLLDVDAALTRGWDPARVAAATGYDPWFVDQLLAIIQVRRQVRACETLANLDARLLRKAKRAGFGDAALAVVLGTTEAAVRDRRHSLGVVPVFKTVDTCAAEFAADTPYHYSCYEEEDEARPSGKPTVIILGSGPNRIGQGIEFDYCCVHAVYALREAGYDTVMVNCNPETVSTDYDTADRLYFEPLTLEDVLAVVAAEQRHGGNVVGVLVQLGGQTPLKLAHQLEALGVPILGTPPEAIDRAEDRGRFGALLDDLGIPQPPGAVAGSVEEALAVAGRIGFPVLVRPSYVLGGRAMEIVYGPDQMRTWLERNSGEGRVLVDRFLEGAVEVDVDAVFDGGELFVGGVLEHIEEAGVHSGDSACVIPPYTLGRSVVALLRDHTEAIARALGTRGLINMQYAVRDDDIFVLEANPRASRTTPFVSKATGVPLAKIAARVMLGASLAELRRDGLLPATDAVTGPPPAWVAVKEAVLPWKRFPAEDRVLGPEMRSTGEVMGLAATIGGAYAKGLRAAGHVIPRGGTVFLSLDDRDKHAAAELATDLIGLGFRVLATHGTAGHLARHGVAVSHVDKVGEGPYDPVRLIELGEIDLVINTPGGSRARSDAGLIRRAATRHEVPCVTTVRGGSLLVESLRSGDEAARVNTLQRHHLLQGGVAAV